MKKPKLSRFPKQAARRNTMTRSAGFLGRNSQAPLTKQQVVSSMYAYLMTSCDELPDENKRALGFDFVVGGEGEEVALNHLARLFMDYADLSFRRALVARRRRLGIDE